MAGKRVGKKAAYVACYGGCRATAECRYGCVDCGVCVSVCPVEAIECSALGVAQVQTRRCIGCGRCVRECPRGVLRMQERGDPIVVRCANHDAGKIARELCAVSCIGCGVCERVCPSGAITVREQLAQIEQTLCLSCGQCLVACPRGVIADVRGILRGKGETTNQ